MTPAEVDAFLQHQKSLPAAPVWREESRSIERRANLPIEVEGIATSVKLNVTIRLDDPDYLMLGISVPPQICRLCLTTGHRDRATKRLMFEPHFHSWELNRRPGAIIPKRLDQAEPMPHGFPSHDEAFAWFLNRHMIAPPHWLPVLWPPRTLL